jgi:hypothetical protein
MRTTTTAVLAVVAGTAAALLAGPRARSASGTRPARAAARAV